MYLARKILIPVLAAGALITTASITGEATAWATTIAGYGEGYGSTAAAAEGAAQKDLVANYRGCHLPANLVYDTETNGVWHARVTATCAYSS